MTGNREELCAEIKAAMALCKRVAAGLASGTGYQPPEDGEGESGE